MGDVFARVFVAPLLVALLGWRTGVMADDAPNADDVRSYRILRAVMWTLYAAAPIVLVITAVVAATRS